MTTEKGGYRPRAISGDTEHTETKTTAPGRLIDLVNENCFKANRNRYTREGFSRLIENAGRMAVASGMVFTEDDLRRGVFHNERFYTCAIVHENKSFCVAFEAWAGRKPFIADDVEICWHGTSYVHISDNKRSRERLGVGMSFRFGDMRPEVTSFAEDGKSLIACTYKSCCYPRKIERRLTITRKDIIADRKTRNEGKEKS